MTTAAARIARRQQQLDELMDRCFGAYDAETRIIAARAWRARAEARLQMYSAAYKRLAKDDPRRAMVKARGAELYRQLYG